MKRSLQLLCVSIVMFLTSAGQSYHFSQFFSTPLLTNPGNTGFMDGSYRASSNLRTQGSIGGTPYITGYVSADMRVMKENLYSGKAGVGMYVMNDQSIGGALQTNTIGLSTAYHVTLSDYNSEWGEQTLGIGFQGTYNQRRLDYNKLSFENQYRQDGFNASLPIGENFTSFNKKFFDVNTGISYNRLMPHSSFFWGVSVYNLLKHKENINAEEFQMPTRINAQAGGQVFVGEYGKVYGSLTHMRQAKANITTIGAAYGYQLINTSLRDIKREINMGVWYRYKDAIIPYIGFHLSGFHVGLSYDHSLSSIKTASNTRNGFELTMIFHAPDKSGADPIPWY